MTFSMKFTIPLLLIGACAGQSATLGDSPAAGPEAKASLETATYCFVHERFIQVERTPPSYVMLRLRIRVSYRNPGSRPLIFPLQHERTIYTALKPGVMDVFHEPIDLFATGAKTMKELPFNVSPENPLSPKNDVFGVIPAGGESEAQFEEFALPVNHKGLFRHDPDLRGHSLYLRLKLTPQEIAPGLETALSERWEKFGVPWSGTLMTNTLVIPVPQSPNTIDCSKSPENNKVGGYQTRQIGK